MFTKQVLFRNAVREKLLAGATALADAIRVTLGAKPKCVPIAAEIGPPDRLRRRCNRREGVELKDRRGI